MLIAAIALAAVLASQPVQFADVTERSGIRFSHQSAAEKKYIVESMSGGVVLIDFDDDGLLDVYFINSLTTDYPDPLSATSRLYRNVGGLTFSDVTDGSGLAHPGWGMGGCAADYDGDGRIDIYVTAFGANKLYRNRGQGRFEDATSRSRTGDARWSAGCAFGDYDNDGDLDLFVANYVDFRLDQLPEFGKGPTCRYRSLPVQCGPRGLKGAGDTLYQNNGDGTFEDVSKSAGVHDPEGRFGMGAAWTDWDQDGWIDLIVANDAGPNLAYRNRGDGTFEEMGFMTGLALAEDGKEQGSMGIAIGDTDRDGRLDLYLTNFADEYNALYRNLGGWLADDRSRRAGLAEPSFAYVGWGTGLFDFDNDGWLDLLAVNGHVYPQVDAAGIGAGYAQPKLLLRNNGDGTFRDATSSAGPALLQKRASRGAAFGDLDNDGDVDVVINDLDGPPMLLENRGGNRQSWLRVRLQGPPGNRQGIGARVTVTSGGLSQVSEVRSGGSYLSQSDFRLHFGLGKLKQADRIEVRWPGGKVSELKDVPANQEVIIPQ